MIKSLHNVHICQIMKVNNQAIVDWIISRYIHQFRDQPDWNKDVMRNTFTRDLGLDIKDSKL